MSYLKKISQTKAKDLKQMSSDSISNRDALSCCICCIVYMKYKHLLAHLYWRHGTEGFFCNTCGLKRWKHAQHVCHVLPINERDEEECTNFLYEERESDYCLCGVYLEDSPMIGCDGAECALQWYHFKCVGIVSAPDGEWFCPECVRKPKEAKEQGLRVRP